MDVRFLLNIKVVSTLNPMIILSILFYICIDIEKDIEFLCNNYGIKNLRQICNNNLY